LNQGLRLKTCSNFVRSVVSKDFLVNQITWKRTGAHNDPGRYGIISDTLLYCSKSENYCWNQPYGERSQEAVETSFCYAEKPDNSYIRVKKGEAIPTGWRRFQSVTLRSPNPRPNLVYEHKATLRTKFEQVLSLKP